MEPPYTEYYDYVDSIVKNKDLSTFKSNNLYNIVLEHVSFDLGAKYLQEIMNITYPSGGPSNLTVQDIVEYCRLNDSVGKPVVFNYQFLNCSPSSLRYIHQSHLILKYMQSLNLENLNIIELGGGYGGLCLAINFLAKKYGIAISSYKIIDLPQIAKLQELYLSNFKLDFLVECLSCECYENTISSLSGNNFLISNYCYSEISQHYRDKYTSMLFPYIGHGFLIWNDDKNNFTLRTHREEIEYPQSGYGIQNKFIYF